MPTPMFNIKPHYYASTESGNAYYACNQSATSTTAGLATTWTGLAIGNPAASGFNLVMRKFLVGQAAAGTAGAVGIMGGAGSITASITPLNLNLGLASPASVAHATAGQTISTPVLIKPVASLGSVATTA